MVSIFSRCNKYYFSMRYCPFQGLKRTISHPDMGITMVRNGLNRNAGPTVRDCKAVTATWRYSLKEPLLCLVLHFLTSLSRFYFVKKKSRKTVSPSPEFSFKKPTLSVSKHTASMYSSSDVDL